MTSERRSVAKNTIIQIVGKGLSTLLGLLSFTLLWRLLGPSEYGTLTIALTFLAVFATFVDFGLTLTTVQLISEFREKEKHILGNLLSLRIISAGIFLGAAPFVAMLFPYDQALIGLIAIGILSYYSASVTQMLGGIFQKNLDMTKPMYAENLNRLFVLIGLGAFWFTGATLAHIMWLFVAGNIVQLVSILYFTRRYASVQPQISLETWKLIISRSWPIGASIFFNLIYLKGDIVFLSLYRDAFEVGLYGTAYKIIEVVAALPVMYMGLILPILVREWSQGSREGFQSTLQDAFDFFAILAVPISVGLALVGTEAITLVAGEEFAGAGPVLWLLGPAMFGIFFGALFGHAIVGLNRQKQMTKVYALVAVITVLGYLWHIPQYGMYGAAFWTLVSELSIALIAGAVVLRVSQSSLSFSLLGKSLISSIFMGLAVYGLSIFGLHVLLQIAGGVAVYYIGLSILGGPTLRDFYSFLRPA